MNAALAAGIRYGKGSANGPVGEHELQLIENHIPILASCVPVLHDPLRGQVEHLAQRIIVGKAGLSSLIRVP